MNDQEYLAQLKARLKGLGGYSWLRGGTRKALKVYLLIEKIEARTEKDVRAAICRNERDRGETLSFRERIGLVEDFKPKLNMFGVESTVRRRHGRLIGSRNGKWDRDAKAHKVSRVLALEEVEMQEFRAEVHDLDLHRAIEALSEFEYWRFLDYLMGGMSEAQAFVHVQADIVEREREELEESRREAALDFASYSEKDFYDYDLENGDFEDDLETAASYDDSYDPPTD